MNIKNLHEKQDWENYYKDHAPLQVKLKSGIFTSYDIYLCDYLINRYLPRYNGTKEKQPVICEIGSGDGLLIKKIANMVNYKPYGIEYSTRAVKKARGNGVETYIGDAFDIKVRKKFKNKFDAIFSYGFVEHILPVEKAVNIHVDLVKPGGYVIIQIPRFRGFNFWRLKLFRPDLIENHNLEIMNGKTLERVCKNSKLKKIYCNNYGTFKLRLPMEKKDFKFYVLKGICTLDYILNPFFRLFFGNKGFETYLFSPSVMFIGKKKK